MCFQWHSFTHILRIIDGKDAKWHHYQAQWCRHLASSYYASLIIQKACEFQSHGRYAGFKIVSSCGRWPIIYIYIYTGRLHKWIDRSIDRCYTTVPPTGMTPNFGAPGGGPSCRWDCQPTSHPTRVIRAVVFHFIHQDTPSYLADEGTLTNFQLDNAFAVPVKPV